MSLGAVSESLAADGAAARVAKAFNAAPTNNNNPEHRRAKRRMILTPFNFLEAKAG
jgi:hypothetical protein